MSHAAVDFEAGQCASVWKDKLHGTPGVHCCALPAYHEGEHRCACGNRIAGWSADARNAAENLPRAMVLTSDTRQALKAEAHRMWFDAVNAYYERNALGEYPEVNIQGVEEGTVRSFVGQVLDPLLQRRRELWEKADHLEKRVQALEGELKDRNEQLAKLATPP